MRGPFTGPRAFSLLAETIHFIQDTLGLRIALDLLNDALLLTLIERADPAEKRGGYLFKILSLGVVDPTAKLVDAGSCYHFDPLSAAVHDPATVQRWKAPSVVGIDPP